MTIIPFRPRLAPSSRKPPRGDRPDRWNPRGWRRVWMLTLAGSFVIALAAAYRDLGSYMPDWLPRLGALGVTGFELMIDGRAGQGRVVDGDTLALQDLRIRLDGIDAPEMGQTCRLDGREADCGQRAARFLKAFVAGKSVACDTRGIDRYGRALAVCVRSDNRDLGRHQVANGWAFADHKYAVYIDDEAAARRDRLGFWAGTIIAPRAWRSGQR